LPDAGGQASDWGLFYDAVAERPPHDTVVAALDSFAAPGSAVDLGCGDGRDARLMLERGWRVLAIDAEPAAIERLSARVPAGARDRLETLVSPYEDARWPEADLVNASFSLPFCARDRFDEVWERVRATIAPGGRFAGQLFGDRDSWVGRKEIVFLPRARVEVMLDGLELERFDELEEDGQTALGEPKHWHVFHVIARQVRA
jgi:SAM-dependent methyltransferase